MNSIPSGAIIFPFTDIEGSIKLAQEYHDEIFALLGRHDEIFGLYKWYHRPLTTATAQALANIAFTM